MIAILDYDMGNLRSVSKALEHVGAKVQITRDPKVVAKADKLVLPGVGAFKDCIGNLKSYGLVEPILKFIETGKPFLGICVGMQMLMTESEEGGQHFGLNIFKGKVLRFPAKYKLKVPHMGWNNISVEKDSRLLKGLKDESFVYFVHSYYVVPTKKKELAAASTKYGVKFTAAIEHENVFATQFHPEKSQDVGLKILKNFVKVK